MYEGLRQWCALAVQEIWNVTEHCVLLPNVAVDTDLHGYSLSSPHAGSCIPQMSATCFF